MRQANSFRRSGVVDLFGGLNPKKKVICLFACYALFFFSACPARKRWMSKFYMKSILRAILYYRVEKGEIV